jgi:NADPH-dependent 2,4-dienoyl-CoA reductase/sulfur reductase-like enzyme
MDGEPLGPGARPRRARRVAVVGAGAAGLTAAIRAAESGARVPPDIRILRPILG